jgi:hypothetical protein
MTTALTTIVIGIAVAGFILFRLFTPRQVSIKDLLLPVGLGLYAGYGYLQHVPTTVAVYVGVAALVGVAMGLLGGFAVKMWQQSGTVYQRGGLAYLMVFVVLIALRIAAHVMASSLFPSLDASVLNAAFIAMGLGNLAGRSITVLLRAAAMVGWDLSALPASSRARGI